MKNNTLRKKILVGIIFLFIIMSLNSSIGKSAENKSFIKIPKGNILYVGGNGEGNYSSIQDAIDNASDGNTVFVFDDSSPYNENINIDKSINLIGEDKNSTIIDGSGKKEVIYLSANNIEILGFTIRKSSDDNAAIFVYEDGNSIKISDNIIEENYIGIFLDCPDWHYKIFDYQGNYLGSNKNFLVKNLIKNNTYGIYLKGSSYNTISQNFIKNNNFGIKITQDDYPAAPNSYGNCINKNVFIRNDKNAFDKCNNRWKFNYWDDWIGLKIKILRFLPYPIPGTILRNFDWSPVNYPNGKNNQEVIYD